VNEPVSKLRLAVIAVIAGWMILGPAYTQFGLGERYWFVRRWVMYHGFAKDVCMVEYEVVLPDGSREGVDRYEVLGYTGDKRAPKGVRVIKGRKGIEGHSRRLCNKMPAGTDMRLVARCADNKKGWKWVSRGKANVCAAKVPAKRQAPPKGRVTP